MRQRPGPAVVFDFGGVILDDEAIHCEAIRGTAARSGVTLSKDTYYRLFAGRCIEDIAAKLLPESSPASERERWVSWKQNRYEELRRSRGAPLCRGVRELLSAFDERGIPLAIASSSSRQSILEVLESEQLGSLFEVIVAREDVATAKPAPDCYLAAARRLRRPAASCVAIEDAPCGVVAAKRAELVCVAVTPYAAKGWHAAADLVVRSLEDLDAGEVIDLQTGAS